MKTLKINEFGPLQIRLLRVLWKQGPCTVQVLLDWLTPAGRPKYVTVLTVMRRLERRGLVTHHMLGRTFCFEALVTENEIKSGMLRAVVSALFDSPAEAVSMLLDDDELILRDLAIVHVDVSTRYRQRMTECLAMPDQVLLAMGVSLNDLI